jgi:hypothetical protein
MNDWQDLVELERLALWMDSKGLESGSIEAPLRLTGGTQNLGYTDLMVDGAPSPHQSDTTLRWLIDRLRS